jgi:DNA mismatch endonuclease, patch repair protein
MRANLKTNTKPELAIRSLLHRRGRRFRTHLRIEHECGHVRPDIVFTRARLAIFVDGCFWHRCPIHGNVPRKNTHYWAPKLRRNVERDLATNRALRAAGWHVLRLWEHMPPDEAAAVIDTTLNGIRSEGRPLAHPSSRGATEAAGRLLWASDGHRGHLAKPILHPG